MPETVVALDRLWHERRRLAVLMGDAVHDVFVDLHVVGGLDERGERKPSSFCDGATSWWCFSTWTPMSNMTDSISARRSLRLSTGGTGK